MNAPQKTDQRPEATPPWRASEHCANRRVGRWPGGAVLLTAAFTAAASAPAPDTPASSTLAPVSAAASDASTPAQRTGTPSRISRVTVYPGSATVERVLRLAPGARRAVFACLPATLDAQSLQASADAGISVGEASVRVQARELLGDACLSPLETQIRSAEDRIATLQAEHDAIDYATGYLKSFGSAAAGKAEGPPPDAGRIATVAQALREQAQGALARQHALSREREALERELQPLLAERERLVGKAPSVSVVQVNVATRQGGELRLSYQVRGPGWQPAYRAALDTQTRKLMLVRQAQVAQNTGEDWNGVQLLLSTGQPRAATQGPLPRPWRLGIAPPPRARAEMAEHPAPMPSPAAPMAKAQTLDAAAEPEQPRFDVEVFEKGFATEFAVPQAIDVPSSGERITLTLNEHTADTQLAIRTAPAQGASAWLIAQLEIPPGVWPAGPMSLYRDGAYVGAGRFDATAIARTGFPFGRDELVDVSVETPRLAEGTTGLIGSRNERKSSRKYTVTNRHRDEIRLQVLDAAPISEHENVKVESRLQPPPKTRDWNEQPGTVLWEQPLAAGATARFEAEHLVTWPKDAQLRERQ